MSQKVAPQKKQAHLSYPRASSFYAYANCPASYGLSQQSGEEPPTPHSDRGTEIHQILSGKIAIANADADLADEANALATQHLKFFDHWLGTGYVKTIEARLWLREGLRPVYSGEPDVWGRDKDKSGNLGPIAALSDYKTGWHPLDDLVATNCQIRAYAGLINHHTRGELQQLIAAIHKPGKQLAPALFDRGALEDATRWSIAVATTALAWKEREPKPDPVRGPWCRYCSGKVLCPLWREELSALSMYYDIEIAEIADTQLRAIAPKLALAAQVIDRLESRLRQRVRERPDFFGDWRFEPGDFRRKIDNVIEAYNRICVEKKHLNAGEFLAACRITIGDLETRLRKKLGLTVRATQAKMIDELDGIMETKRNEDKLVYDPKQIPNKTE